MSGLFISGGMVVTNEGPKEMDLLLEDGCISIGSESQGQAVIDASGHLIYPGFIDCHVHFREPGGEHKATMATEALAARHGGVTTVCEMPNTSPATTTIEAFSDKVERASAVTDCDIRFFFGITEAGHLEQLRMLWSEPEYSHLQSRCSGVKVYLDHSTGNQKIDGGLLDELFAMCGELEIPMIGHCEDPEINDAASDVVLRRAQDDISQHSEMRPPESEAKAIADAIALSRKHGAAFHVAHMSTAEGAALVRDAKAEGLPITCEVAPHHLLLTTDHYEVLGTHVKMNPPIRDERHLDALWEAIEDGTVDCIATDHAPHTIEEKQTQPPLEAPSGVPGVETMIPLLLTAAAEDPIYYQRILDLCFTNPNRIFDLRKESIADGAAADIVIVNPSHEWEIHGDSLHSKCGWTPYEGATVKGAITHVLRAEEDYALRELV